MAIPQKVLMDAIYRKAKRELSQYGSHGRAVQLARKRRDDAFIPRIMAKIRAEANKPDLQHVTQWHIDDLMHDM